MIIVNACFGRVVKKGGRMKQEFKGVTGIALDREWDDPDGEGLRNDLRKHAPEGDGWVLEGYANATPQDKDDDTPFISDIPKDENGG